MNCVCDKKSTSNECGWRKTDAELAATHKRLELEKEARSTTAKLPKLTRTKTQR